MATTSDIRKGLTIVLNGKLYRIVDFMHVKPGRGSAFVRTKLKAIPEGNVIENTFPAGHKIEIARVEKRPHQFLYKDGTGYHFMDMETYEEVTLQEDMIEGSQFLKEGQEVFILFHAETETPLTCELPVAVVLEVVYTEPGVKGDTASGNSLKPAKLETGVEVKVPLFINTGDKIKIDTRDGKYIERVKE